MKIAEDVESDCNVKTEGTKKSATPCTPEGATPRTPKSSLCSGTKTSFASTLLAEWGMLPKSTRIQQKLLEESEREPSDATSTGCSPYNRIFSLPRLLPSPSSAKTPTRSGLGPAATSPLFVKSREQV